MSSQVMPFFISRSVIDVSYMYGTPDMDMLLNFASNDDGAKVW